MQCGFDAIDPLAYWAVLSHCTAVHFMHLRLEGRVARRHLHLHSGSLIADQHSTGWPVRLMTSFCWHQITSCVSVLLGVYTVTELSFWCQQKLVNKLTTHPVSFDCSLNRHLISHKREQDRSEKWRKRGRCLLRLFSKVIDFASVNTVWHLTFFKVHDFVKWEVTFYKRQNLCLIYLYSVLPNDSHPPFCTVFVCFCAVMSWQGAVFSFPPLEKTWPGYASLHCANFLRCPSGANHPRKFKPAWQLKASPQLSNLRASHRPQSCILWSRTWAFVTSWKGQLTHLEKWCSLTETGHFPFLLITCWWKRWKRVHWLG